MVPLTVRSHYSLMWGTDSIRRICRTARQMGYRRLALTDSNNLYGLWGFLSACAQEGITPIVGAELTDSDRTRRAVCLVEDPAGYRNLCRLITHRHTYEAFDLQASLVQYGKGLSVLSQHIGLLMGCHDAGMALGVAMPGKLLSPFHPLRQTAQKLNIPIVAVPESFFGYPGDMALHRILRAIEKNTVLSRLEPQDVAPPDAWFASSEIYSRRFVACPEAVRATEEFAERLSFTGPKFGTVLPPRPIRDGRDADQCLRHAAYDGARKRYGKDLSNTVVDRLEYELRIISNKCFSTYFLVVQHIVSNSPRICGRGSGAASLVAYCLGITNVCPVKHHLYFERFLNPGRMDPPDLDVDFAWDERDDVLKTIFAQYQGYAAMVSSHVLFQPRMAIREIAKVYGLTAAEISRMCKRLPDFWRIEERGIDPATRFQELPKMRCLDFPDPWPEILGYARRLIGTPRYISVHPGGVVITPNPIEEYAPVEWAPKGVPMIQWDKDGAEAAGLVKIDLLGNRSLGVIRDAVGNIRENDLPFDENGWEPEEDPATQNAVARGQTIGCFYIESPAMRLLQQKTGVGDFEHVVIHSSIIRPAANEFIREYIRRLHGGQWRPIHPLLADVLKETFGIMVYQEDVSRVAVSLAGFTHTEADGLRKILSKKDREHHLRDYYTRFAAGADHQGASREQIDAIWAMMMSFNGYSFCKPHSASYARVSFQAAYLKVHYPAEFMAAVISNQGGFYSAFAYVSEARRSGLKILPPDVLTSDIPWKGGQGTLRVGLLSIKGLKAATQARIITLRQQELFRNVQDFFNRVHPEDTEVRALIHSGALDSLHCSDKRFEMLWLWIRWRKRKLKQQSNSSLFDGLPGNRCESLPVLPEEDERERLRREFSVLGFLCDRHPMTLYTEILKNMQIVKASDLPKLVGKRVHLAGWLITGKKVRTKYGDTMEFLTFEDETGIVETVFFPKTYFRFGHMLEQGRPYILTGRIEADRSAVTLTVHEIKMVRA